MSTPAKPGAKPKRPLSGYNLFYRYKRNRLLEETAHPNNRRDKAIIHAVLTAVPGLEGVPPHSPVFAAPIAHVNAYRAASIRAAMEGKLFPNENNRKRPHCKVHGMGFVEMGRVMRQTWGRADLFTKDLFGELADVGRVRYRRLVAEYKLKHEGSKDTATSPGKKAAGPSVLKDSTRPSKVSDEAAPSILSKVDHPRQNPRPDLNSETEVGLETITSQASRAASSGGGIAALKAVAAAKLSLIPDQARSSSDPILEALSTASAQTLLAATAASAEPKPEPKAVSRSSYGRQVSTDLDFHAPDPRRDAQSYDRSSSGVFGSLSFDAMMNLATAANATLANPEKTLGPSIQRKVSADLDRCGDSLQPVPVETSMDSVDVGALAIPKRSNVSTHGRRVSTDVFPAVHGSVRNAPAAFAMGNSNVGSDNASLEGLKMKLEQHQLLLKNRIKDIRDSIVQNNLFLPPEMQVVLDDDIVGEGGCTQPMASSSSSALTNTNYGGGDRKDLEEGAVSAQDFMEFIDELDEAIDIDDRNIDVAASTIEKTKDCTGGTSLAATVTVSPAAEIPSSSSVSPFMACPVPTLGTSASPPRP